LRHNILLWLDEKGETHRRMLWQRFVKIIRVYPIPNGIANTMLCLSLRSDGRRYLGKPGDTWGRSSMPGLGRKNVRFWKIM